jgi:hypothetical protein
MSWFGLGLASGRRRLKLAQKFTLRFAMQTREQTLVLCRTQRANIWPIWLD